MSRRSRRKTNARGGWMGKALLGLIIFAVLGTGVVYAMIRSYLHSEAFRSFLSEKASAAAKVDGSFTPFRWEGLAVDTENFSATGKGMFQSVEMDGLHTEIGVGGLRRGVWEIKESRAQRIRISLDARAETRNQKIALESTPPKSKNGWFPSKVEVHGADVGELAVHALLDHGTVRMDGLRLAMKPTAGKHAYLMEASGGTIQPPPGLVPEIRLKRAKMSYRDSRIHLTSATAAIWQTGFLDLTGEWDSRSGSYSFQGDVSGVKCEDIFSETWAKRFTGDVESDFFTDNFSGDLMARGHMRILNGTLTALPMLDALAAYADTRRFRVLTLNEARTDWRWKDGALLLSNLALGSEGLVRIEGSLEIKGRDLDGSFRLGLAPGTLAGIPGAETHVFAPGERGLLWAPLRISGNIDDPKEDLTARLVDAAGMRMFEVIPETGEKVIRFSRSILGDSPIKVVDQGAKIIEKGVGIAEGVGGVIDGFFGSKREVPPAIPPTEDP